MPATDLFLGHWSLIPELSIYQLGDPPASGSYTIREERGELRFELRWHAELEGPELEMAFGGPPDGSLRSLLVPEGAPPGTPDGMTITRVDERTLDSEARLGARVLAYARRSVSRDGELMAVLQEMRPDDGPPLRNVQVYRRAT